MSTVICSNFHCWLRFNFPQIGKLAVRSSSLMNKKAFPLLQFHCYTAQISLRSDFGVGCAIVPSEYDILLVLKWHFFFDSQWESRQFCWIEALEQLEHYKKIVNFRSWSQHARVKDFVHFSILLHVHSKLSVSIKTIRLLEWTIKNGLKLMFQKKKVGGQKMNLFILLTTGFQLDFFSLCARFQGNINKYCRQVMRLPLLNV